MIKIFLTDSKTHYLTHPGNFLKDLFREIHAVYQRGTRGYADADLWSLDNYLSEWMPDALDVFIKKGGTPGSLVRGIGYNATEREHQAAAKLWKRILRHMKNGFIANTKLSTEFTTREELQELVDARDKGLRLFAKYFGALWY